MPKKYITIKDLDIEIQKCRNGISYFEKLLEYGKERLGNLQVLEDYLIRDGLCPYSKKELFDDNKLQYYILPLKLQLDKNYSEEIYMEKYLHKKSSIKVDCYNLENVLDDFINFVCECKGCKIGVGRYLIEKYLCSREFE